MPWRPMTSQDLPQVQILADTIHVDHPEDLQVFEERLRLYPQGCLALEENGRLIGYALTHPWHFGTPPALNALLGAIPSDATTYYVHDVALLPEARGKGYATQAGELLMQNAQDAGLDNLSLVAVNNSQAFWERLGFRVKDVPGLEAKLLTYGPDAVLMVRNLTQAIS
ncbi:GNAT family N-acetyltransferase [Microvirga guangxiensis]|uniref:Ribosomal protein S18 acetylase RimI n=1 Tax=Microvirga guangxiensis TaxID=549386 RepID=A0A1G5C5E8_9HYPH|nr:GNAT family N-acetyltransferase [Microvirga guangxiensis]SCX97663.1 Ribosomal protein S18 acetylase RimI [Microvirga guangxiensis]